jgi:hypothetical protein
MIGQEEERKSRNEIKFKYPKLIRIRRHLINLIENSTSHGLPSIFKTPRPVFKIMWFIFFIVSTSFGIYMLTLSVLSYLSWSVVSHVDIVFEQPALFPTISFQISNNDKLAKNFLLEDFFIESFWNYQNMSFNDYEKLYDSSQNMTYYKFNSGKNRSGHSIPLRKQTQASALSFKLFTGLPPDFNLSFKDGLKFEWNFYIHNVSMDPFTNTDMPIVISPGKYNTIFVKRTFVSRLGEPYNNCKDGLIYPDAFDSSIFKFILTNTKSAYRQSDCFNICQAQYLLNVCNSKVSLGMTFQIYASASNIDKACFQEHWIDFIEKTFDECSPYCPLECSYITYEFKTVAFSFAFDDLMIEATNPKITKFFPSGYNITYQDLVNSIARVSILYEDFNYSIISQTPQMGIIDLISNMGGLLGLFIGEFLSLLFLLLFFFKSVYIY